MSVFLASICTWDFSEDPLEDTRMGKKQKSYSTDIKARVAREAMRSQKTVAQIARE